MAVAGSTSTTTGRRSSLIATCDQWVRASHQGTAVDGAEGILMLSWDDAEPAPSPGATPCIARGLATDRLCRIYTLAPTWVERQMVGSTADGLDYGTVPPPVVIIGDRNPDGTADNNDHEAGPDFTHRERSDLHDASGLAIDHDDRLIIADRAQQTVSVLDLWSRRLMRTIRVAVPGQPGRHPVAVAAAPDGTIWALLDDQPGLLRFTATRGPVDTSLPTAVENLPADARPVRIAVLADGTPVLLFVETDGTTWIVAGQREPRHVGRVSDIVVDDSGAVVMAPCPSANGSATLLRLTPTADGWTRSSPLDATGYDGNGLVVTNDGRIGYQTATGFRLAVIGRVDYKTEGRCVTYRLDSGSPLNKWGRLFIEACLPAGTDCRVATVTSDDDYTSQMTHVDAEPAHCVPDPEVETPDLPPDSVVPAMAAIDGRLHQRDRSSTPWWPADDAYQVYEAPVRAKPGRYLWVTLRLMGNRRRSPRLRELRIEHQAHGLMRRLPAVFSADGEQADFLHRYLAPLDGVFHDLELRSRCRDILVDPHGTPVEAMEWLASFFGLVLDNRWAEAARRQLIAEIVLLYRRRGTVWSLSRYIELFLAGDRAADPNAALTKPIIVEHYRLRGLGGPLLGADPTVSSRSVLGHGFRVGGEVGNLDDGLLVGSDGGAVADDDSAPFASTAHQFTVLIPRILGAEEDAAIRHILDRERPAHTAYTLCTVDAGMRAGQGLHLGMSSIIGPTGAFEGAVTDLSLLGRGAILGGPTTGISVEAGRLGHNTRVG